MTAAIGFPNTSQLNSAPSLEGRALRPLVAMHGQNTKCTALKTLRITSKSEWRSIWLEHNTGNPDAEVHLTELPVDVDFDFESIMVVGVFNPKRDNSAGFTAVSISEEPTRIIIKLDDHSYQTLNNWRPALPWGILALPRSTKEIVLELDERANVRDPPLWKKWRTIPSIKEERP
jgi:hypothetical protein